MPQSSATDSPRSVRAKQDVQARRLLSQCGHCYSSRGDGTTLFKCGACQVDTYCSRQCQKAAWAVHKEKCAINRCAQEAGVHAQLKNLRGYTDKHRPTIAEAAIRSLGLAQDVTRAERWCLIVHLQTRPNAQRTDRLYQCVDAEVAPFEVFGLGEAAKMRRQLQLAGAGVVGTAFVVMMCVDPGQSRYLKNIVPVGFEKAVLETSGLPWKEWMMRRLDEGAQAGPADGPHCPAKRVRASSAEEDCA
ncbi:hypothetical protein CERSUDRAFT_86668 [Gelatoporia subvermispora B]|uniref:MYND-type domain-containing protein n=1 Tax=Ceriporiopsis subvermispora (strain B) TaxID=914234 RepID=M2R6M8_CERS8|nr:hypothetical protein CERSUDRAFT_86668 [Gelatoporia subvermispora B]